MRERRIPKRIKLIRTLAQAWLRAVVASVEDDLYCVGNVASSGRLWVKRDRVRLVRRLGDDTKREIEKLSFPRRLFSTVAKIAGALFGRLSTLRCCSGRA